jgi:hypothetical protein
MVMHVSKAARRANGKHAEVFGKCDAAPSESRDKLANRSAVHSRNCGSWNEDNVSRCFVLFI